MSERGRGRPTDYKDTYPDELVKGMKEGKFDYEILADWDISRMTFLRWRKEKPELQDAHDRGMVKFEAYWSRVIRDKAISGDDTGFKPLIAILNNKCAWNKGESGSGITNNTQINVSGTLNILQGKTDQELIENIQQNFEYLSNNNVLPKGVKVLVHDAEFNEQE